VGLAFFVLAWLAEAETLAEAARIIPYAALVGLTHVQATWLLGVAGGAMAFSAGPVRKRLPIHIVALSGTLLVMVPWLVWQTRPSGGAPAAAVPHFGFEWHTPATKLAQFFAYTLDNFSRRDAESTAVATFTLLVLGPLLLSLLPARPVRDRVTPLVLLLVAGALYAVLPMAISGPIFHWYTYPRYATVFLLWLLLIPRPRLRGRYALALAPGILAALLMDVRAMQQFESFGARARPYLQVVAQVPPRASVLAIVLDDADPDPDLRLPPYHQFYAYIAALRHGYSPQLWSTTSIPLIYRPGSQLPAPDWNSGFSMDAYGKYYDFVLVQGIQHGDPVRNTVSSDGARPRLVTEIDRWRLYQLH
jgi:hypothetical protein